MTHVDTAELLWAGVVEDIIGQTLTATVVSDVRLQRWLWFIIDFLATLRTCRHVQERHQKYLIYHDGKTFRGRRNEALK